MAMIALSNNDGNALKTLNMINNMIYNNWLIIGVFLLLLVALALSLYYFATSLISTISTYNTNRVTLKQFSKGGDSIKDTSADNELYPEPIDPDDVEPDFNVTPQIDPKKFMPRPKREFISELELQNVDYNKKKSDFLINELNYVENDDVVDDKVLYADYDDYKYGNDKEE